MIQIDNVTRTHRRGRTEVRALRGVSCEIASGSFAFIVGPSGSGKSTLLYLIGALDRPTSGEIVIEGRRLSAFSARDRDRYRRDDVGFVFQSFNLLNNLNAVDNVLVPYLPAGVRPELRRRAEKLLKSIGLDGRLDHRPGQLSGGEQQRVAIARALLKRPRLVLADEPTGELDSQTGTEIFDHLRRLNTEQGATVIVVTHDHRYLRAADRVLELRDGRLAESTTIGAGRTA